MASIFDKMSPEQIQAMIDSKSLSPETQKALKERLGHKKQDAFDYTMDQVGLSPSVTEVRHLQEQASLPKSPDAVIPEQAPKASGYKEINYQPKANTDSVSSPQTPLSGMTLSDSTGSLQNIRKAESHGIKAADKLAQVETNKAKAEFDALTESYKKLETMNADQAKAEIARQEQLSTASKKFDTFLSQAESIPVKADFWANKSTEQKIGMGIGLFLGGFAGAQGRDNPAVKVIENAINTDLEIQKQQFAAIGHKMNAAMNVYTAMRQQFGDARQAEIAARANMLGQVQAKLALVASQYKGPEVAAALEKAKAELNSGISKLKNSFMESESKLITVQLAAKKEAMATPILDPEVAKLARIKDPELKKKAIEQFEQQEKTSQRLTVIKNAFKTLADLRRSFNPDASANRDAAQMVITSNTKHLFGGLSETEVKMVNKALTTRFLQSDESIAKTVNLIEDLIQSHDSTAFLNAVGIKSKKSLDIKKER